MSKIKAVKGEEINPDLLAAAKAEQTVATEETKPGLTVRETETVIKSPERIENEILEAEGLTVKHESHSVNLDTGKTQSNKGHDPLEMKDRVGKLSVKYNKKEEEVVEEPKNDGPIQELTKEELKESDKLEAERLQEQYKVEKDKIDKQFEEMENLSDIDKMYEMYRYKGLDHDDAVWSIEHLATVNDDDEYYKEAGIFTNAQIRRERLEQQNTRNTLLKEFQQTSATAKQGLYLDLESRYKPQPKQNVKQPQEPKEKVKQPIPQAEEKVEQLSIEEKVAQLEKQLASVKAGQTGFGEIASAKMEQEGTEFKVKLSSDAAKGLHRGKRGSDIGVGKNWDVERGTYKTSEQHRAEAKGDGSRLGDPNRWTFKKA